MLRGVLKRCLLLAWAIAAAAGAARAEEFDVILRRGTVLDGSGLSRYRADVGIRRGHIARIGDLSQDAAATDIDASGLFVAPGFINIHDHPEPTAIARSQNMLTQGVTTEIGNPDGAGSTSSRDKSYTDLPDQAKMMAAHGLATNLGFYIGFNAVWAEVMGPADRRPTEPQVGRMQAIVLKALQDGAWGVSAGLDYKPAYFARLDEVARIVSVAKPWRTNFPNHEKLAPESGYSGLAGVKETAEIGRRAGLAPVFTHMKAQGQEQGRSQDQLDLMDGIVAAGGFAAGDIYPYTYGFNNVRSLLIPAWALDGGEDALYARFKDPATRARIAADIEQVMRQRFNGPTGVYILTLDRELTDLMAEWGVSAGEAVIRLNEQYRGRLPETYLRFGVEGDVINMMRHPNVAIACDCGALGPVAGHPRAFGTFPFVLGRYVREQGVLTWETAVQKMTALPASIIGVSDRGLLAPGMSADVTVFDPATIADRGTAKAPQLATGVRHVLVNGVLALKDGAVTGAQGGEPMWRGPNMPSRPFNIAANRSLAGTAVLQAGERITIDLRQGVGRRAATGALSVKGRDGRVLFVAEALGFLQATRDWATITGQGRLAGGDLRAFTLIVDKSGAAPARRRAVDLAVDGGPDLRGVAAAGLQLTLN